MALPQHKLLALLSLIASAKAAACPPCYTHTVSTACPYLPAPEDCYEDACLKFTTKTIPGLNPACLSTPTVTAPAACETVAKCRKGCYTITRTVKDTSAADCGVHWETDQPSNTGGVSWATEPANTGSVSWETTPTAEASVSWDKRQIFGWPTNFPKPSFGWGPPPQASISWGKRQEDEPEPTQEPLPEQPNPTDDPLPFPWPTNVPKPSFGWGPPPEQSISLDKRQDFPWPTNFPKPSFGWGPPTRPSISWGKRQDEPEPTLPADPADPELPGEPEQPENPFPFPWPTNVPQPSFGWGPPPAVSVSWDKRQDGGIPTDFPWPSNVPKPSYGWGPPASNSISWGKRQDDGGPTEIPVPTNIPQPPDTIGLGPPASGTVSWGKRQDDSPLTWSTKELTKPSAHVTSHRRERNVEEREAQQNTHWLSFPDGSQWVSWDIPKPTHTHRPHPKSTSTGGGYVSWDKRDAEPQWNTHWLSFPSDSQWVSWDIPTPTWRPQPRPTSEEDGGWVSWDKRDPPHTPTPVPFTTTPKPTTPFPTGAGVCPMHTVTVAPPCVPPTCPNPKSTPCDYNKPLATLEPAVQQKEDVIPVVEKTIVTIKTLTPTGTPVTIKDPGCTVTPTTTLYVSCPTYTCVPWCEPERVVR